MEIFALPIPRALIFSNTKDTMVTKDSTFVYFVSFVF